MNKRKTGWKRQLWTEKEEEFLRKNYKLLGPRGCSNVLNRTYTSVKSHAIAIKITSENKSWTQEETDFLIKNYTLLGGVECSKILKRTKKGINKKAVRLNLQSKTLITDEIAKERLRVLGLKLLEKYQCANFIKHKVQCHCGKIFYTLLQSIFKGDTKSCGCYQSQQTSLRFRLDLNGFKQKTGKLQVIKYLKIKNKQALWLCKCECGKTKELSSNLIKSESVKTCGNCYEFRNGIKTSFMALDLHQRLIDAGYHTTEKDHNYKINNPRMYIDIAIPKLKIAIEYDSKKWHKNTKSKDLKRVKKLQKLGWKVLVIRSKYRLPKISTINKRIEKLLNGSNYEVITCKDWY